MNTFIAVLICLVVSVLTVNSASKRPYEDRFVNYGVYKIENRAVAGVLSFNKTNSKVTPTTAEFDDKNPGQRWRLDESSLYTAFELRPTLDENFVLEYFDSTGILRWMSSWGWGNNKLWYLQDAGDGYTLIKNKHNDVCLQSMGLNQFIDAFICDSRHEQHWKLVYTS